MALARAAIVTLSALAGIAVGHDRRAQAWSGAQEHIWGHCDSQWSLGANWVGGNAAAEQAFPNVTSCELVDAKCSDRLSDGPSDADLQIVLGGLPPSTAEEGVHLQWWASRASPSEYEALGDVSGCAVYENMAAAYPKYYDADFNGGNVRVNESGEVVIRVRSPSSYLIYPYVLWPHIHIRVCTGEASTQFYYDSLAVGKRLENGVYTKSQDTPITVISAVSIESATTSPTSADDGEGDGGNPSNFQPIGYLVVKEKTTTLAGITSSTSSSSSSTSTLQVAVTQTTTTDTTTTAEPDARAVLLEEAMSQLKLDALEFSPIYQCLLEELVFDHFSGQCSGHCPEVADLHRGQCVLPADELSEATFTASWNLEVDCADLCGASMENETLHHIRLSVAGHLDIPFQEVEHAAFAWLQHAAEDRRLSGNELFVTIRVKTQRHTQEAGLVGLSTFFDNLHQASQLLGMPVLKVTPAEGSVPDDGSAYEITDETDPFAVSYEVLLGDDKGEDNESSAESNSTLLAVVVAGTVAFGCAVGLLAWALRQRLRRHRELNDSVAVVDGKKVDSEVPEAGKGGEPDSQAPETAVSPEPARQPDSEVSEAARSPGVATAGAPGEQQPVAI